MFRPVKRAGRKATSRRRPGCGIESPEQRPGREGAKPQEDEDREQDLRTEQRVDVREYVDVS